LAAWLMLPAALTERLPLATLTLPRPSALLLGRVTLAAAWVISVTAPVKALAVLPRLMAPLAAVKQAGPPIARAGLPAWWMLPAAVTVSAPFATAMLPRLRALLFARVALPAAGTVRLTAPLKALAALARLMVPFVAVKLAAPPPARAVLAAWLILPVLAVTL